MGLPRAGRPCYGGDAMDDITRAILDAWAVVGPKVRGDPVELAKRLARRRMKTLRKPPRAWCLAIRAGDTRLTPMTTAMVPDDAAWPGRREYWREHQVIITAAEFRRLCRPVTFLPCGYSRRQVAEMLGVHPESLEQAIKAGVFGVEMRPWGRFGKYIRVLRTAQTFDPSAGAFKKRQDWVWGANWGYLADTVSEDFEQAVTRVPYFQPGRGNRERAGCIENVSTANGWKWVCPGCGKQVRTIYLPVRPTNLPEFNGFDREMRRLGRDALARA